MAQRVNASMLVVVYNESVVSSVPSLEMEGEDGQPISIPVLLVSNGTGKEIKVRSDSRLHLALAPGLSLRAGTGVWQLL